MIAGFRKSHAFACSALVCMTFLFSISGLGLNSKIAVAAGEGLTANVGVTPSYVAVRQGGTFTVNLSISNVENLYAYEIKVWYNNSVIGATSVVRPLGHFLQPVNPDYFFEVKWEIRNDFNATHGRIWLAYALLNPETPRSGDGVLASITFQVLTDGATSLVLDDCPGREGPVKLADYYTAGPIPHTATDGFVNVKIMGDVNGDDKVDAIDLTAVAVAFGSRPSDAHWNSEADLDGNKLVNILDLLRVLTNYGRTS